MRGLPVLGLLGLIALAQIACTQTGPTPEPSAKLPTPIAAQNFSADWQRLASWTGRGAFKHTESFNVPTAEWRISWDTQLDEHGASVLKILVCTADGTLRPVADLVGQNQNSIIIRGSGDYYLIIKTIQRYVLTVDILVSTSGAVKPVGVSPSFRIVDVHASYGHMIVEVQHFHPDGSHWFYENYAFQGRELYRFPQYTPRSCGGTQLHLSDGRLAPIRAGANREEVYYLPPGEKWLRLNAPFLDNGSITSVIQKIHEERATNGWTKGQERHVIQPLEPSIDDASGADSLVARFAELRNTAYWLAPNGVLLSYDGLLPPFDPLVSTASGTVVSTIYPGNDPESTSMDAQVGYGVGDSEDWSAIRERPDGVWGHTDSDSGRDEAFIQASPDFRKWRVIKRTMQLFDTSTLGESEFIDSATFDFVVIDKVDDFAESLSLVLSTPASNTDVVLADFDQFGMTKQATDVTISSLAADLSTYHSMTLNSTGLGNISLTGITKFGVRITADADDSAPIWARLKKSRVRFATADEELAGDKRPRLVVTHHTPADARR